MVKGTHSASSPVAKIKPSVVVIDEKPLKPPGSSRFSRNRDSKKQEGQNQFKKDNVNIAELCQQLLVGGYVQSYVDFYHLTHRLEVNGSDEKKSMQIPITVEDMVFIRDNLVSAEISRRQGDTQTVYSSFNKLADFYVHRKDWKTGFFFHEKSLEVAQLTNDVRAEMAANHALGLVYQLMLDFEGARKYHERHEDVAASIDVFEEIAKANVELYKVYLVLAEKLENEGQIEGALKMYFLCLEAAKKSWDRAAEGEANGKIGNVLLNRGEAEASLPYLRIQSQIAADLGNAEGRCRACSALAHALDLLGQADKALNELTLVHSISEQAGDIYLQAQACKSLGTLYSKVGKLESAVEILQRHFNLLKTLLYRSAATNPNPSGKSGSDGIGSNPSGPHQVVTARDLDLARLFLGISKGNLLMGSYAAAIDSDLCTLLDWKLTRSEFPSSSHPSSKFELNRVDSTDSNVSLK